MTAMAVYVAGWGLLVALLAFHRWYQRRATRLRHEAAWRRHLEWHGHHHDDTTEAR